MNAETFTAAQGVAIASRGMTCDAPRPALARSPLSPAAQAALALLIAFASYFAFGHFVLQSVRVDGPSMSPTLRDRGRYLLNRWVYHVRAPERGEIVVLRDPAEKGLVVKRIIAANGDRVLLKEGRVYVNGRPLPEPYLRPGTLTFPEAGGREQAFQCLDGQYLVLGDNRWNSADSRNYGLVSRNRILGRVVL